MDVVILRNLSAKETHNFNVSPAAIVAKMLSPKDRSTDEQCFSRLMKNNWQLPLVNRHSNGKVLFLQKEMWHSYIYTIHVLVYLPHFISILNKHVGTYCGHVWARINGLLSNSVMHLGNKLQRLLKELQLRLSLPKWRTEMQHSTTAGCISMLMAPCYISDNKWTPKNPGMS